MPFNIDLKLEVVDSPIPAGGIIDTFPRTKFDLDTGPVRLALIEDNPSTTPRQLHQWNTAQIIYTALSCNHQ